MAYIKYLFISLFIVLSITSNSFARPLITDLSMRQIEIDSGFQGTEILLFGARNDAGDVVVVVRGPEASYVVRKKERFAGIWVNKQEATFTNSNGFYAAASSRPVEEIRNNNLLNELEIGVDNLHIEAKADDNVDIDDFRKAFLDNKQRNDLYLPIIDKVSFIGDTLFRTIIKFPENIPRGIYTAEAYLFSDGQLIGVQSTPLVVKKKGFDALVYDFAYNYPALYGIMAILIALIAGWAAGILFRKV